MLIEHFLRSRGRPHVLAREVLDALVAYDWPGNVRELENAIERMTAMNSGPVLHSGDLPSFVQNHLREKAYEGKSRAAVACTGGRGSIETIAHTVPQAPGVRRLDEVERQAVLGTLAHTRGDLVAASYLLGVGRTTLYRKVKEYGVNLHEYHAGDPAAAAPGAPTPEPISEVEKRAILETLEHTKGDMVAAAYLLGIGRTTLYRKLREYGIKR